MCIRMIPHLSRRFLIMDQWTGPRRAFVVKTLLLFFFSENGRSLALTTRRDFWHHYNLGSRPHRIIPYRLNSGFHFLIRFGS